MSGPDLRRGLLIAALGLGFGARAEERDWRLGATAGVLLHEVASGNRAPLPTVDLRLERRLAPGWRLELAYGFGLTWGGEVLTATTQLHRLALRPGFVLPFQRSAVVVSLGPAVSATHTDLYQAGAHLTQGTRVQAGASAGAAFEVRLPSTTLRMGLDGVGWLDRVDLVVGLGAMFDLGVRR